MKVTKKEYDRLMRMRVRIFDYEDYIDDLKIKYDERMNSNNQRYSDDAYELTKWFEELQTHLNKIQDFMMQMDEWENACQMLEELNQGYNMNRQMELFT